MATKKTTKSNVKSTKKAAPAAKAKKAPAKKAAPKKAPKEKTEAAQPALPPHPKARLAHVHGTKEALAKSLASSLAREDEDQGQIADRLRTASNSQLLRLSHVVETVKSKYGSRAKLIEAIGTAEHKAKDKDFLAKLDSFSLPRLLDLATTHERRARAS